VSTAFWTAQARALAAGFPGRAEQIRALQVAALAGEHAFLLGPPGTGKTSLVRAFVGTLEGRLFEQTLSRTRPDAAVLGPLHIPRLRDHGRYERAIEGYLLDCEWAFLDEIGHIAPDLGHDLLAALGDRVRHEVSDGRSAHGIPLLSAFTAGNVVPGDDGHDDARALWDRLLVRVPVDYLSRDDAALLLSRTDAAPPTCARRSLAQLAADRAAVAAVEVGADVVRAVLDLRDRLREAGEVFSDRRWRASLAVVRAGAWLDGRAFAEARDLAELRFVLWDALDQRVRVLREIAVVSDPRLAETWTLVERARLLAEVCRTRRADDAGARRMWAREAERKLQVLRETAARLSPPRVSGLGVADTDVAAALAEAARAVSAVRPASGAPVASARLAPRPAGRDRP